MLGINQRIEEWALSPWGEEPVVIEEDFKEGDILELVDDVNLREKGCYVGALAKVRHVYSNDPIMEGFIEIFWLRKRYAHRKKDGDYLIRRFKLFKIKSKGENKMEVKKKVISKGKKKLAVISIKRVEKGVRIYVKSKKLEIFFKDVPKETSGNYLKLEMTHILSEKRLFSGSGAVNIDILTRPGIGKGIYVTYGGVFSLERIKKWLGCIKIFIETLHKNYIKGVEGTINVYEVKVKEEEVSTQ